MDLTKEEQETIIRGYAGAKTWEVVTADPRMIRKMERQGFKPDDRRNPAEYVSYTVPRGRIPILRAEKRKMSEKALEALRKSTQDRKLQRGDNAKTDQNDQALTRPLPEKVD
jgi:hypothetical protein